MAVRIVCGWCGSDAVARDAWATWDVARQAWVLGPVFDDGWCHACACARGLEVGDLERAGEAIGAETSSC